MDPADFDLDTLDDDEFDIPKVSLPTLESILNETGDVCESIGGEVLADVDENYHSYDQTASSTLSSAESYQPPELEALKSWETMSISSNDSKVSKERNSTAHHGAVFNINHLNALSNSMMSTLEKVNAGQPTALSVSSIIAVGTSRGLVLLFESCESSIKSCLGSSQVGQKYGPVTSVEFNTDATRILVGYSKGEILMYDIINGKLLRTITDAHPPGTAVLHVKFTDDPTLAVCNDSGGSVFELNFRRVMGVRSCESRCLFSGSRGEVCTIEPLHLTRMVADHPLRERHILAMGTLTKVLVVVLRPQIKVIFAHHLSMNPQSAPLLAWHLSAFHSNGYRSIDPILMFARGDVIYFFQVKCESWDIINFVHLRTMNLTYKLINFAWFNSQTILLMDVREQLHTVDVDSQLDLHNKTADHVKVVYNSATFKSIATGGNVSRGLAAVGEHACYHSMKSYDGRIFLLGSESLHVCALNTWQERVNLSLKTSHKHALDLALTFYIGSAKATVGLPNEVDERKRIISDYMLDILVEFVDLSMTKLCPDSGKLQILINFYRHVVPVCVDHCLHINRVDVLFSRIYERFRADCIAHGAFLECLEPYIMNDRLQTVSPEVIKSFVEHYQAKNMLESVEACLLHLSVDSLDLNQVMHLCWAYGLYDAILSIHNRGLNDYTSPLIELLVLLQSAQKTGKPLSDKLTSLGNKLLVYVSCCLAGAAYPHGVIAEEKSMLVKVEMFNCLISTTIAGLEGTFPILTTFLHFSTKEFLNVLSLAFSESEFKIDDGSSKVQQVVDILLQVMLEQQGFRPDQVGSLFTFLARQSSKADSNLQLSELLRHQVVEFLTMPGDQATDHEERQQALVELLRCGILDSDQSAMTRMIQLAERAAFFRVLRLLHTRNRRYDLVFVAHLRDPAQNNDVFNYVTDVLLGSDLTDVEKKAVKSVVLDHIKDLISLNAKKSADLLTSVLQGSIQTIASKLQDDPFSLFNFLRGFFEPAKLQSQAGEDIFIIDSYLGDDEGASPSQPTDPETCELYLSLMCQFQRDEVLSFIQECEGLRHHNALDIVMRQRVNHAAAYLLEKSGDVSQAFNILLAVSKEQLRKLEMMPPNKEESSAFKAVNSSVDDIITLCQHNSKKLMEQEREKLWFLLLDVVLKPQHDTCSVLHSYFKKLARHVLTSMIGHISLPAVLQKIIQDPAYNGGEFSEIKNLLIGMLDTYQYEKTLLGTTLNLLARDRYNSLNQLKNNITHAVTPRSQFCTICHRSMIRTANDSRMIIFKKGRQYHETCLLQLNNHSSKSSASQLVVNDRISFESARKQSNLSGEGLLGAMTTQPFSAKENGEMLRTRTLSNVRYEAGQFKLKIRHPPLKFS